MVQHKGFDYDRRRVHLLIPGRGRGLDGESLTPSAELRGKRAAEVYKELRLHNQDGFVIVCGYKSPADMSGLPDSFMKGYLGVPEADLMANLLVKYGVKRDVIRIERQSVDTVTNLAFAERDGLIPNDGGSVGIIAQKCHLRRIIHVIAPRIMEHSYFGIVAADGVSKDRDSILANIFSRAVLFGIRDDTNDKYKVMERRVEKLWRFVLSLRGDFHYNQQ